MSTPKFTPGPLTVILREAEICEFDSFLIVDSKCHAVAEMDIADNREEVEANANLFAAAPELFDAALYALQHLDDPENVVTWRDAARGKLRAALAKAGG